MNTSFSSITEIANDNFNRRRKSITGFLTKSINKFFPLTEATNKRQLKLDILDIDEFIKVNDIKEITNPVFFVNNGVPSPDGLLSNEIFGITKDQRAGTFGYINLNGLFLHPLCYKIWSRMDAKVKNIVHETDTYIVKNGVFVQDPNGKNGVKFLKDSFEQLDFKSTGRRKDIKIKFLLKAYNEGKLFITKYPVIPAYYRDVDTSRGKTNIGEINQMYSALLNASRALKSSADYGLNIDGATRGRIQETLLNIYNWFSQEPNISKKNGIIRQAVMSKTSDYASRLVISAPNLYGESVDDVMVDTDHCALPLASALINFFPFVMYYLTSFFNTEFSGVFTYDVINNGKIEQVELGDWQTEFSPMNIKKQIDRFVHGFSNRLIKVQVPTKHKDHKKADMIFIGYKTSREEYEKNKGSNEPGVLQQRCLTWCDLFYMAAVEATKDKCVLITRYPIDSCYNQYPSLVRISSTIDTEPNVVNGVFYPYYPKITNDMIGSNTSNTFIDTLQMSNAMIVQMKGDYDGDQVTVKGVFFDESNQELIEYMNSKRQFLSFDGINMRTLEKQGIQCIYNLTLILPDTKITDPKDIKFG